MLDEIANRVHCDICDVACYGKEAIKRHYEGSKHVENVQNLPVAMKEKLTSLAAKAKLHQECGKNVQDLLQNEAPINSLFVCDIPDPATFHKQNIVTKHLEDKKTGGTLGEATIKVSSTPRSLANAQPIVNDVVKTQIQTEIFHCDSCDVFCYDTEAFKRHKENKSLQTSQRLPVVVKQQTPPLFANDIAVDSLFFSKIPDLATLQNQNIVTKYIEGEKAAGTLNERTTIVPTASVSSANSRVGAQQMVQDVVVAKKESEKVNVIFCDVCNITCNSQMHFTIHKNGKKHIKNTQKILGLSAAIKQETPSSVAKDTKQDLLQKEGTVNPLLVCDIPDTATCLRQKKLTEMPLFDSTLKAREELNVRQPTRCEICNVSYCYHKCLDNHISGIKHTNTMWKSIKPYGQSSNPAVKQSLPNPMIEKDKIVFAEMGKRKTPSSSVSDNETSNTKRHIVMQEEVGSGVLVTCRLCGVACDGITAFNYHLASFEHSAMVWK